MDEADVAALLDGRIPTTPAQLNALRIVLQIAENALQAAEERSIPAYLQLQPLVAPVDDEGTSLANVLRTASGGSLPSIPEADPSSAALGRLARDAYPAFLLPSPRDHWLGFHVPLGALTFRHPAANAFAEAVLEDPDLSKLFPFETESQGRIGNYAASTGRGGGLQLAVLPTSLLQDAFHRILTREVHDADSFAREAQGQVDLLRRLARGEIVLVPALLAFTYVRLPQDTSIQTPWGLLRELRETERDLAPSDLSGRLSHTHADGTNVEVDYSGDVVLETEVPLRIEILPSMDAEPDLSKMSSAGAELERRASLISLAITLASEHKPYAFAIPTWQVIFDPLAHGPMLSWRERTRGGIGISPRQVERSELSRIESWSKTIADAHNTNIDIAIRRLQTAIADRRNVVDSLIDLVIAWENLFGSSQGEATLRLSGSLAILLTEDPTRRREIKRQVSRTYGLRSKVVHGATELDPSTTTQQVLAAIDLTVEALRELYGERSDLLAAPSSGDRSTALILGERPSQQ
ncbi:MAG: HEPN domain-containing protein [Actinomycetota bacterium]|nr:HEPN domain-containing protein [Actinomycetota bacterium]